MNPSAVRCVNLEPSAYTAVLTEAAASTDGTETGGILLGRAHGTTIHVGYAGGPGPVAVRRPRFFLRDLGHAQQLASAAQLADGSVWVGEWHTHPAGEPSPSDHDLGTYARLLADTDLGFDVIISIIVTAADSTWSQRIAHTWACYPTVACLVPLTVRPIARLLTEAQL